MKAKWEQTIIGVGIIVMLLWSLTPIYWVVRTSLMTPRAVMNVPPEWFPYSPTRFNYLTTLGMSAMNAQGELVPPSYFSSILVNGLANSIIVAGLVSVLTVLLATPMAYAFSRHTFPHKRKILFTLVFTRALPPVTIAVPYYRLYFQFALLGTRLGLIIVYLAATIPITAWILIGFFSALPTDVEGAARVDGLGRFAMFRRVFVPMAAPSIAIASILAFLMAWNEYSLALILTAGTPAMTLPVSLRSLGEISQQSAALTLSLLPPLLVALGLQRYITRVRIIDPIAG